MGLILFTEFFRYVSLRFFWSEIEPRTSTCSGFLKTTFLTWALPSGFTLRTMVPDITSVEALAVRTVLAFPSPYVLETSSCSGPTVNVEVTTLWLSSSATTTSPDLLRVAIPAREPIDLVSSSFLSSRALDSLFLPPLLPLPFLPSLPPFLSLAWSLPFPPLLPLFRAFPPFLPLPDFLFSLSFFLLFLFFLLLFCLVISSSSSSSSSVFLLPLLRAFPPFLPL